jgi:serine/threonine protein kinase
MSHFDPQNIPVEARISDILATWDECYERGENRDPAELCRDCPELLAEVERRVEALRHWNGLVDTKLGDPASLPVAPQPAASAIITLNLDDLRFHAQGGLGAVFQAHDRGLDRTLAVKFPATSSDGLAESELRQRFLREVRVTAALEHPGIVPVHGLGQDADGHLCYAMRFVTGTTLKTAIAEYHAARQSGPRNRRNPLRRDAPFRSLLQRFKSACVTVAYAHSRGFLHRDLKPEHILLGDFDVTLVVDWGLTKPRSDEEVTPCPAMGADELEPEGELRTETGIGTLGFASPEQQAGEWPRVGPASDVFSLGATLYVLLCGVPPFPGSSAAEILGKVERGDTLPPSRHNGEIPRSLEAICMKALALEPADRYSTAQELADDIECWLADAPVVAYPERWNTRIRRWMDRWRVALWMIMAAAVSGLAVVGSGWHSKRLREIEVQSLAFASAEMRAREHMLTHQPGWATKGLDQLDQARRISTPLQSSATLRTLTAACLGGIDLKPCGLLTSIPAGCLAFSPDGTKLAVGELDGE